MTKKLFVIAKLSLKLCFANPKIKFWWLLVIGYYFGRINYSRCEIFIVKRAVVRVLTVTKILICSILFGSDVLVVRIYNFSDIVDTTIATLLFLLNIL